MWVLHVAEALRHSVVGIAGRGRCKNTKHDSLWLLIPKDSQLERHKQVILAEMSRELPWLPGCPLAAEFKGEPAERITW